LKFHLDENIIYSFHIGVSLTSSEFETYGETERFKKLFAVKEFDDSLVYYLNSTFIGPKSGKKIKLSRSEHLAPLEST